MIEGTFDLVTIVFGFIGGVFGWVILFKLLKHRPQKKFDVKKQNIYIKNGAIRDKK